MLSILFFLKNCTTKCYKYGSLRFLDAALLAPVAYSLEVKSLLRKCEAILVNDFSNDPDSCMDSMILAQNCELKDLLDLSVDYFSQMDSRKFLKLERYEELNDDLILTIAQQRLRNLEKKVGSISSLVGFKPGVLIDKI